MALTPTRRRHIAEGGEKGVREVGAAAISSAVCTMDCRLERSGRGVPRIPTSSSCAIMVTRVISKLATKPGLCGGDTGVSMQLSWRVATHSGVGDMIWYVQVLVHV